MEGDCVCEEKAVGWSELKAALVLLKLALAARHVAYWLHSTVNNRDVNNTTIQS